MAGRGGNFCCIVGCSASPKKDNQHHQMSGVGSLLPKSRDLTKVSTLTRPRFVLDTLRNPAFQRLERQNPVPVDCVDKSCDDTAEASTSVLLPCPGITDAKLQQYAALPPRATEELSKYQSPYYLHVLHYQKCGNITTCTTTIRAHACQQTVTSVKSEMCSPCLNARRLVLRKHLRVVSEERAEFKKFSPLAKISKKRVENALKVARLEKSAMEKQLQQVKAQLKEESVEVSETGHTKLKGVIDGCQLEESSFIHLFWSEQQKAFQRKASGMRWHPMMVRFAVLLHSQSPAAYRAMREIGVLKLPAESTLRDYSNVVHPRSGYQMEVFMELKKQAEPLSDNQRWVCLLHDEISLKAGLVYDKRSGELVGFTDSSKWKAGSAEEDNLATHALVFMVVGITSNIKMSIGYFPTRTATADEIFPLLWQAVGLLESVCNLKVIASTSDKASANQRLIRLHGSIYKAVNIFAPDRYLYFFSDAPHLIKTVRNNLASSGSGKNTKCLWNNGHDLLWEHIARLYREDAARELRRTKLTSEHVHLTPQSVMRVYLAAQVLSRTVGKVMQTFGPADCQETARFILLMDKFFDCLNARSMTEGVRRANPHLLPYTSEDDDRFRFLRDEFLQYIQKWKDSVMARPGFTKAEKNKMFLTYQTFEGLQTTVFSMIEATQFLLRNGVTMVLSNRFCQDPLESHFGRHRCLGIRAENPTLWTYGYQENKLRMQRSLALAILPKGNIRGKRCPNPTRVDDTPLPKIRRK